MPAGPAASTVLVTDGGNGQNRSALAAVRALAAGGYRPVVTVSSRTSLAASSRHVYGVVIVPPVQDRGYADAVRAEVRRSAHAVVLPASDAAMVALGAPGFDLVDKTWLRRRMHQIAMPAIEQIDCSNRDEVAAAAAQLGFPVVVKFAVKSAQNNQPVRVVRASAGIADLPDNGDFVVQPFVRGTLRALAVVVSSGRLVAAAHQRYLRIWPAEAGTASAAVSIEADHELEEAALELLAGYDGIAQLQVLGGHVIDVNPRVYGSLPLAVASGVNLPSLWCDVRLGRPPAQIVRGRPGVRYRWMEGDVRGLLHACRHRTLSVRELGAALIPHAGTAHSVESLRDPAPLVARLRHAVSAHG